MPARLLVLLYKHRWDIEKVFYQLKSKMNERKSWASTQIAKTNHALFECLAHNLALLFERHIIATEGLSDQMEERRKEGRVKHRRNREGKPLDAAHGDFVQQAIQRVTQRSARFIRWLAAFLYRAVPWSQAIARLAHLWRCKS